MKDSEVMNIRQTAAYLGVTTDTLYKHLQSGYLPGFKIGNRWRVKKSLLDQWMVRQSTTAYMNLSTHTAGNA